MPASFVDRVDAGRQLAQAVQRLDLPDPLVLALPRGGVPVAAEIARALHAPLDLLMVRKIGAPWQPELALAAVADGSPPQLIVDEPLLAASGVERAEIERRAEDELREIARRRRRYLGERAPLPVAGRTVLVVDDGIATGTTVRAALAALRRMGPARLVLAVPVAPPDTLAALRGEVDALVCLVQPDRFESVSRHYRDFTQVEDDEVQRCLRDAAADRAG